MRRYQYDIPGRYDMVTFRNKRIRNNNFQQYGNIQAKILQSASLSRLKPNLSRFASGGRRIRYFSTGAMLPPAIPPCARLRHCGQTGGQWDGALLGLA
jgi:hypothetical protein